MRKGRFAGVLAIISIGGFVAAPALSQSEVTYYYYDELGRLVQAQEYQASVAMDLDRYCYDDAGNRTQHYSDVDGSAPQCPEPTTEGSVDPMVEDPQPASAPPPNNAPDPSPDYVSGMCATTSTIDVLVNDNDVDGDPLQLVSLTPDGTGPGSASSGADGLAAVDFGASNGLSAFLYVVADDRGGEATGQLTVETSGC